MGLSHAAAGAVIFIAAGMAGFQISDDVFDNQTSSLQAWKDYHAHQRLVDETSFIITEVKTVGGPDTQITMRNTGSTIINENALDVFLDGAPVNVASISYSGGGSGPWVPGLTITLHITHAAPSSTLVMDELGNKEMG